jgi:hypothetical protein
VSRASHSVLPPARIAGNTALRIGLAASVACLLACATLLVWGAPKSNRYAKLLQGLGSVGVLTVGETDDFFGAGDVIGFRLSTTRCSWNIAKLFSLFGEGPYGP